MNSALMTTLSVALFTVFALVPMRPRRSAPFTVPFALGWWMNEVPFIGLWWLLAGTLGTLLNPQPGFWWSLTAGCTVLVAMALVWILVRAGSTRRTLSTALQDVYGPRGAVTGTRPAWWRIVLLPIVSWRPDVRRIRNRRYGPARIGHLLDVYVSRRRASDAPAPVLVYFHVGGLGGAGLGGKSIFAHAMMYRLAARGWVCISANYRMYSVEYAGQVTDASDALRWARTNAREFGGDPDALFVAGGSSGANLAVTAALTGAPVRGAVGLYGYYGAVGGTGVEVTSPHDAINAEAPPALIVHGAQDAMVRREDARCFVDHLRAVSRNPVAYAELQGANHNFDFFPSLRLVAVADAVQRFIELVLDVDRLSPALASVDGDAPAPQLPHAQEDPHRDSDNDDRDDDLLEHTRVVLDDVPVGAQIEPSQYEDRVPDGAASSGEECEPQQRHPLDARRD